METQTRLSRHNKFISAENIYIYIYNIYIYIIYIYIYPIGYKKNVNERLMLLLLNKYLKNSLSQRGSAWWPRGLKLCLT